MGGRKKGIKPDTVKVDEKKAKPRKRKSIPAGIKRAGRGN